MATPERLYYGQVGRVGNKVLAWILVLIGPAWVVLAAAVYATSEHLTTVDMVGLGLLAVFGAFETAVATPRLLRKALADNRRTGPYLEIDEDLLLFVSLDAVHSIERARLARCEHVFRMDNPYGRSGPLSVLRMFDTFGAEVDVWDIRPMKGRAVARWLTAHGVATSVRRG